jgi:hypothetical protein
MDAYTDFSGNQSDTLTVIIFTLCISIARLILSGMVSSWWKKYPGLFGFISWGLEDHKRQKFHENLWYSIWHFLSFTFGCILLGRQDWVYDLFLNGDGASLLRDYPQHADAMGAREYYLLELSFWISCCAFLFFETRRKDIIEMIIHHISTVALVLYSYSFNFTRSGLLIMAIHDVGDIFLYSAKTTQYRGWQRTADVFFAAFALAFYIPRLIILPVWVAYPLIRVYHFPGFEALVAPISLLTPRFSLSAMISVLCILICLHVMWGITIARMVVRTLKTSKSVADDGDPRSDDEHAGGVESSTTEPRDDSPIHLLAAGHTPAEIRKRNKTN